MADDSGMWVKVYPEYAGGAVEGSPPAPVLTNPEGGSVIAFTSGGEGDAGPTLAYGAEISPNDNGETVTIQSDDPTVGGEVAVSNTSPFTDYVVKVYGVNVAGRGNAASTDVFQLNYNEATGGDVSDGVVVDNYNNTGQKWRVHTFTSDGTFSVKSNPKADEYRILMLGAGGNGQNAPDLCSVGGGGGGGFVELSNASLSQNEFPITVGQTQGQDTTAFSQTAYGGGRGAPYNANAYDGASGGGGGRDQGANAIRNNGRAIHGDQGYNGAPFPGQAFQAGGGGGGAGGAGSGGTGGPGRESDITGTPQTYGAGGNGAGSNGKSKPGDGFPGAQHGVVIVAYQIGTSTKREIELAKIEAAAREAGYESGYIVGVNDGREEVQEELQTMIASTLETSE